MKRILAALIWIVTLPQMAEANHMGPQPDPGPGVISVTVGFSGPTPEQCPTCPPGAVIFGDYGSFRVDLNAELPQIYELPLEQVVLTASGWDAETLNGTFTNPTVNLHNSITFFSPTDVEQSGTFGFGFGRWGVFGRTSPPRSVVVQGLPGSPEGASFFLPLAAVPVPEPTTSLLLGLGIAGLAVLRRRHAKA